MKKTFLLIFIIIAFTESVVGLEIGLESTTDQPSKKDHRYTRTFSVIDKKTTHTHIYSLEAITAQNKNDALFSFGRYDIISKTLYTYYRIAHTAAPKIVPGSILETEIGHNIFEKFILIGNYRFQRYILEEGSNTSFDMYTPGFDYYFDFPGWLTYRLVFVHTSDNLHTQSFYSKFYYDFSQDLRGYLGYAEGNEAYRIAATSVIAGDNSWTTMCGLKWTLGNFALKLDYASQEHSNGIHNDITNAGVFTSW